MFLLCSVLLYFVKCRRVHFTGTTPIGEKLNTRILNPLVYAQPQLAKPVCIYTITDGEPDNRNQVRA